MLWIEISSGNWLQCLAVILGQWRAQTGSHQAVTGFSWLSWRESSGRVKSGCRVPSWDMPVTDGGGLLQCNRCDSQPFGRGSYRNWRGRIKEQESAIGGKVTRVVLRFLAETTGLDTVPTSTFGGSQPTKQVHSNSNSAATSVRHGAKALLEWALARLQADSWPFQPASFRHHILSILRGTFVFPSDFPWNQDVFNWMCDMI